MFDKGCQLGRKLLRRIHIWMSIKCIFYYPNPKLCNQHQWVVIVELRHRPHYSNYILYSMLNIFHHNYPMIDSRCWLVGKLHYRNKLFQHILCIFRHSKEHKVDHFQRLNRWDQRHIFLLGEHILDSMIHKLQIVDSMFCINHQLDNIRYLGRNTI